MERYPPHSDDTPAAGWVVAHLSAPAWMDPLAVVAGFADTDGVCALVSGTEDGQTSHVLAEPTRVLVRSRRNPDQLFDDLNQPQWQRGVVALVSYDAGARRATGERGPAEPRTGADQEGWPDLILLQYRAWLTFEPQTRSIYAVGLGADPEQARNAARRALTWLNAAGSPCPAPPAATFAAETSDPSYEAGVATLVAQIGRGDLFQANLARAWSGVLHPDAQPFDALYRLAGRASAYGAALQVGDRALVSNSPELFLTWDPSSGRIETRPIKGTRPRAEDLDMDQALARDLGQSAKDRAENLMIVDLMRNDLSRVAQAGSVRVDQLFEIQTLPTVHHLVSTVSAQARPEVGPADMLDACFPPGSITGAPKHQAMMTIAALEAPRGPWCGSLVFVDETGRLTASVLIRTIAFGRQPSGWHYRTLAGAGIVADSHPADERRECDAKLKAITDALTAPGPGAPRHSSRTERC